MPAPDYKPPAREMPESLARTFAGQPRASLDDVLDAVVDLGREVAELRRAIAPPPSPLILGREAVEAFNRLPRA